MSAPPMQLNEKSGHPAEQPPAYPPPGTAYPPPQQGYPPHGQPGYPPPSQPGYPPAYGAPPPGQPVYGAPPPGPAAYPTQAAPVVAQPVTVVHTTRVQMGLREAPGQVNCQHCNATVVTATSYDSGLLTWIAAGGICLFGCWAGCCLIPFCVDACKDVAHSCPNCKNLIYVYKKVS